MHKNKIGHRSDDKTQVEFAEGSIITESKHKSNGDSSKVDMDWASPRHMQTALLILTTFLGSYLCYLIARPFLPSLGWAIGLSVLATPTQKWLETKIGRPSLCAFVCTIFIGLFVAIPLFFALQQLMVQASNGASQIDEMMQSGEWRTFFHSHPKLDTMLERIETQWDIPGIARFIATSLSQTAIVFIRDSVYQLVDLGLTFYLLFFLLRDRVFILETLSSFSPLTIPQMVMMYRRVNDTIHATVYGSFVVAAVQGTVLGMTFWYLDLPAPFFWGLMMACLAVTPIAGAFMVWGPTALFLAARGDWLRCTILIASGVFVIVIIDNVLRPALVGRHLKVHTALVFISVVGGVLLFGPSGALLGPMVLTITQVLLELGHLQRSIRT